MEKRSATDKKTNLYVILYSALCVAIFIGALFLGRCTVKVPEPEVVVKVDTTIVLRIDTFIQTKYYPKIVKVTDTVEVPADTSLLREQKYYEDSLASIWVSGIDAQLDSARYYIPNKEIYIEKEITKTYEYERTSGWSLTIGPYVGYGFGIKDGVVVGTPEIGIGVSVGYSFDIKHLKKKKRQTKNNGNNTGSKTMEERDLHDRKDVGRNPE